MAAKKTTKKGRPTKKTAEAVEKICGLLKAGNTRKTAALAGDITEETFSQWMKDPVFSDLVIKAENEAIAAAVASVKRAGIVGNTTVKTVTKSITIGGQTGTETVTTKTTEIDWKASAWFLERKDPDQWKERIHVENEEDLDGLTDEQLANLEEIRIALAESRESKGRAS